MKLRPFSGSCTTSRFSMTSLISAVVVWSSGAVAPTVTCSATPSTPSVNSRFSGSAEFEREGLLLRREARKSRCELPPPDSERRKEEAALSRR